MSQRYEEIKQYLKNKSVALVGPATYMDGSNYGNEIDSHDIVVRINRGIESIEKYGDDIGRRTDILYSCLVPRAQQAGKLKEDELLNKYKIKYIIVPPMSGMDGICHNKNKIDEDLIGKKQIQQLKSYQPLRVVDYKYCNPLAEKIKCKPNTGFLSICDLLDNFDLKKLSIYGISFYLDGFIPGQKEGVEKEKGLSQQEFADLAHNSKRHVQKNMYQYAKQNWKNNPIVNTDKTLTKILDMNEFSREEFKRKMNENIC